MKRIDIESSISEFKTDTTDTSSDTYDDLEYEYEELGREGFSSR